MPFDSSSFRDPAGHVFTRDGKICRSIFRKGLEDYDAARRAGIHRTLVEAGLLMPHEELTAFDFAPEGTMVCLSHPPLPMVSYPWEWPFSMLKDAALLHLDIMEMILPEGFWLRDASAFNVQYDGRGLRLIDTLSIGQRLPDSPWVAYRQFCSHFLAPLAMAAYRDVRLLALWRNYIDGIPLDFASRLLPATRLLSPGLFMHLVMHARFQRNADRREDLGKSRKPRTLRVSDAALLGLVRSLRKAVQKISWERSSELWEHYGEIRNYGARDLEQKSRFVESVVERLRPEVVWDLGANTGEFSLIAASRGAFVVSIDSDPACTEYLYRKATREEGSKRVLPLTMDLANPSPGLGWNNAERLSLRARGPADLLLALALVHHLVFSCCVPLALIAEWFASISNYLIVEFVPPTDPMAEKLLENRRGEHLPYSLEEFRAGFGRHFAFVHEAELTNGRSLFFCRTKRG